MGHFKGTVKFTYLKFAAKVQQILDIRKLKNRKIARLSDFSVYGHSSPFLIYRRVRVPLPEVVV